jgi:4-amino-4-deoxy-L-arabinose transferase-like glycosyltransferase
MDFVPGSLIIYSRENKLNPERLTITNVSKESTQLNRDSLAIFFLGSIIFTVALKPEFISIQARFALFAQEMLRYGPTFFPTTYKIPYPDYPATSTFMIYLVSLLFGKVTPFSAVLPTALTSALILVVTYRIGAMQSRKWGLFSVLSLLSTYLFFDESRSISLDQYVSLATVLCFYLVYSAGIFNKHKRLWFIPLILAVSFSFRGPIGLIIPASVICSYYLWRREFRKLIVMGLMAFCVLILCSVGLLAAANFQGGEAFAKKVIVNQATGRMVQSNKSYLFYWYNCIYSCAVWCPLAMVVMVAGFKKIVKREDDNYVLIGYLMAWILIILVGMSIPASKHTRYIAPIVPAISLVSSYLFVDSSPKGILFDIRKIFLSVCSCLPLLASLVTAGILFWGRYFGLNADFRYIIALALLAGLATFVIYKRKRLKAASEPDMPLTVIVVLSFIFLNIGIIEPVSVAMENTRPFVEKMKSLQREQQGQIVFYQTGPDGEDIRFAASYDKLIIPAFITNSKDLLKQSSQIYFISRQEAFDNLPVEVAEKMRVEFDGKIGHKDFVVFTQKQSRSNEKINACVQLNIRQQNKER